MRSVGRPGIFGGGLSLYLIALGFLGLTFFRGSEAPRGGFADRSEASATLVTVDTGEAPWVPYLHRLDEAVASGNVSAGERALHEAYTAALGSRRWEGMIEVGHAYLRIGDASGSRRAAAAKARQSYLTGLFRARQQGSVDGVLLAAEGFHDLGDREVVLQCLRIAEHLATTADDGGALARIRAFSEWLSGDRVVGFAR